MHLFFQSLIRYLSWWIASIWPGRHDGAPLHARRLLFLLLFYPAFLFLQLMHWFGFLCDELCFPGYRKVAVKDPVFVLGIPRSGTTFLHRSLAKDPQFTSFSTWEAILAPSVTERKIVGLLKAVDRTLGAPLNKLIQKILRSASGDFNDIHEVGLSVPEEDYLSLLPAGGCFILFLAFPFSSCLRDLSRLDEVPEKERQRLLDVYKRALQRHLYCHPGKRLLSKNAAFATWASALQAIFPGAGFLICVREPCSALSSQLSSLAPARRFFGTDPDGTHTTRSFLNIYTHSYRQLARFVEASEPSQVALIEQSDMKAAPAEIIRAAVTQLDLRASPPLERGKSATRSTHRHAPKDFALDTTEIEGCMNSPYETMLRSPNRTTYSCG
ncbi:sulfotransferase [Coraliomargarita sinensis]|uniref:Sulfotransferase n=1 Tax=Coraliomargarita sinensis TaxID=2174842 RepID=A0A317ZFL8_9BACT|nr:sulfotransferase [Coraliomargarita sinensis]PXA02973.1 sulfotransferase [Coraliomargarita sinensis]